MGSPARHKLLHQSHEPSIVSTFKQVDHFMHDDVLQTLTRFFGQLGVETNGPRQGAIATLLRFHPLHVELQNSYANDAFPFRDQSRYLPPDLLLYQRRRRLSAN